MGAMDGGYPQHASVAAIDSVDLAAQLRARGMRVTPQREQVLQAVRTLKHATPEQISEVASGADVTTVYRTLELLEEIGLVRHMHLGHGAPSYRPAEDEHGHIVCHVCGAVVDTDPVLLDELAGRLLTERGFVVDRAHFTVSGRCADCAAADAAGEQIPSAGR
jgi:Fur family transcriptional regulator, ferric uptake regulator